MLSRPVLGCPKLSLVVLGCPELLEVDLASCFHTSLDCVGLSNAILGCPRWSAWDDGNVLGCPIHAASIRLLAALSSPRL